MSKPDDRKPDDHDPLCPMAGQTSRDIYVFGIPCECDLIARVRAEERRKVAEEIAQAIEAEHVDSGMFCCFSDQRHVALVGAARVARRIGGES